MAAKAKSGTEEGHSTTGATPSNMTTPKEATVDLRANSAAAIKMPAPTKPPLVAHRAPTQATRARTAHRDNDVAAAKRRYGYD